MDNSFFEYKKHWSKYKDHILGYYLKPYLEKIKTQRRPILLVDAFAGPGEFKDGEIGSPLIICKAAKALYDRGVSISVICNERDSILYNQLSTRIKGFSFAKAQNKSLSELLPELAESAKTHSTFLYLDPYTTRDLNIGDLSRLFSSVKSGRSVEVLMNFNAAIFLRWALAAMKREIDRFDADVEDPETLELEFGIAPEIAELNGIAGGDYWQEIVLSNRPFAEKLSDFIAGYKRVLARQFNEVCAYPIKANWRHVVPKYFLVFGSRSDHALRLMNDATASARKAFAETAKPAELMLFETRPLDLVPDNTECSKIILEILATPMQWRHLLALLAASHFSKFTISEWSAAIGALLKSGILKSNTGKTKINDDVIVFRA